MLRLNVWVEIVALRQTLERRRKKKKSKRETKRESFPRSVRTGDIWCVKYCGLQLLFVQVTGMELWEGFSNQQNRQPVTRSSLSFSFTHIALSDLIHNIRTAHLLFYTLSSFATCEQALALTCGDRSSWIWNLETKVGHWIFSTSIWRLIL